MSHDPVNQTITLAPITPASPVVLCDSAFLSALAKVEREIANTKVTDAQSAQAAAVLQGRLTKAGVALEEARKTVKAPFLAKCTEIDLAAKAPATRIEQAKTNLKKMLTAYDVEQRRIATEAEAARQAELRRLEQVRQAEEAERRRKIAEAEQQAREAAEKLKAPVEDFDFDDGEPHTIDYGPPKTETEKRIDELRHAPAVKTAAPAGIAFKSRLIIADIDVDKLPDCFVKRFADEAKLRATYCVGWKEGEPLPEVSGVTFKIDRTPVSTGRPAVF